MLYYNIGIALTLIYITNKYQSGILLSYNFRYRYMHIITCILFII